MKRPGPPRFGRIGWDFGLKSVCGRAAIAPLSKEKGQAQRPSGEAMVPYLRIRRGRRAASRNEAIGKRKGLGLTPCPLTENPCEPRGGSGGFVCGEGECSAKSWAQAGRCSPVGRVQRRRKRRGRTARKIPSLGGEGGGPRAERVPHPPLHWGGAGGLTCLGPVSLADSGGGRFPDCAKPAALPRWDFCLQKLLDKSGEARYTRHVVSNN